MCELFAKMGTKESVKLLIDKITNIKDKDIYEDDYFSIFENFDKHYSIIENFISELFDLQKDSLLAYPVIDLFNDALKEKSINTDILKKYENQILDYCKNEYRISFIKEYFRR